MQEFVNQKPKKPRFALFEKSLGSTTVIVSAYYELCGIETNPETGAQIACPHYSAFSAMKGYKLEIWKGRDIEVNWGTQDPYGGIIAASQLELIAKHARVINSRLEKYIAEHGYPTTAIDFLAMHYYATRACCVVIPGEDGSILPRFVTLATACVRLQNEIDRAEIAKHEYSIG